MQPEAALFFTHVCPSALQVVVAMLDPLQEGGPATAAATAVLDQLVVKSRHLLKDKMKSLPPLPQGVDRLGTAQSPFTVLSASYDNASCLLLVNSDKLVDFVSDHPVQKMC